MTDHLPTPLLFVFPADSASMNFVATSWIIGSWPRSRWSAIAKASWRAISIARSSVRSTLFRKATSIAWHVFFQGQFWSWDVCAIL